MSVGARVQMVHKVLEVTETQEVQQGEWETKTELGACRTDSRPE